jgi:tetratricopeptide (TPR) repeat protein
MNARKLYSRLPGAAFFLAMVLLCAPSSRGADDALEAAQRNYVLQFFSLDAHVNLAKQQCDRGNRLQAFYTLETARREHFEQAEFTRAFRRIFLNDKFDNSPQAEAALRAQVKASPSDFDALNKLADIYISREEWARAIPLLESASKVRPQDFAPVAALAQVYERMNQKDKSKSTAMLWVKSHPESPEAYNVRISELLEQEKSNAQPLNARPLVDEALSKYPDDPNLHFSLGVVLERANDVAGAQREFEKAAHLGTKADHIQGWVARFYYMRKIDMRRALDLYLNAYFLDPEFYETEFAEDRILKIAPAVAQELMDKSGTQDFPPELLPAAEKVVLRHAEAHWSAGDEEKLLKIMGSEDEVNRATAMTLLGEHPSPGLKEQAAQLLNDPDPRKRGMAAYLAVKWGNENAFALMKKWLEDPAELVRFDAISALLENGGPQGRKLVSEYARSGKETNLQLRSLLSDALK